MNDRLPKREEVPAEMTWRLEDIYPDEVLWEKELEEAKELAAEVGKYEGRLGESARNLYEALKIYDALRSGSVRSFLLWSRRSSPFRMR